MATPMDDGVFDLILPSTPKLVHPTKSRVSATRLQPIRRPSRELVLAKRKGSGTTLVSTSCNASLFDQPINLPDPSQRASLVASYVVATQQQDGAAGVTVSRGDSSIELELDDVTSKLREHYASTPSSKRGKQRISTLLEATLGGTQLQQPAHGSSGELNSHTNAHDDDAQATMFSLLASIAPPPPPPPVEEEQQQPEPALVVPQLKLELVQDATQQRKEESSADTEQSTRAFSVELQKHNGSFGFQMVGSKSGQGVFVRAVRRGGAAASVGTIKRGDQIISVNGVDFTSITHTDATDLLRECEGITHFEFLRMRRNKHEMKIQRSVSVEDLTMVSDAVPLSPSLHQSSRAATKPPRQSSGILRASSFVKRPTSSVSSDTSRAMFHERLERKSVLGNPLHSLVKAPQPQQEALVEQGMVKLTAALGVDSAVPSITQSSDEQREEGAASYVEEESESEQGQFGIDAHNEQGLAGDDSDGFEGIQFGFGWVEGETNVDEDLVFDDDGRDCVVPNSPLHSLAESRQSSTSVQQHSGLTQPQTEEPATFSVATKQSRALEKEQDQAEEEEDEDVVTKKEGWLLKQNARKPSMGRHFRKRYFKLQDGMLKYFHKKPSTDWETAAGYIPLGPDCSITSLTSRAMFLTTDKVSFTLAADSDDMALEWFTVLQHVLIRSVDAVSV
eukprot:m.359634 g.359634  ORF g.359634 m.359634 type:complete len:677 (+) comp18657_c0_seq1:156-2186(+)